MPSLQELETELGLTAGTLTAKPEVAQKWNGYFAEAETKSAAAQKALEDARALQSTIDDQIARFGVNESTNIQLQAQIEALKAAQKTLSDNGINLDLKIPELKQTVDPEKQFRDNVAAGFANVTQAMSVQNRYFSVFNKAMPDDPVTLANEAAAARMSITDYADKKYGFASETQKRSEAELAAKIQSGIDAGVKQYQESHPSTAGHPDLNGGLPSNYPKMPAPRDGQDLKSFSQMPAREKIRLATERANQAAKSAA